MPRRLAAALIVTLRGQGLTREELDTVLDRSLTGDETTAILTRRQAATIT
jgi:hypothetical protein